MIKLFLSWIGLRHDNLIRARELVAEARQTIDAQQETIEHLRAKIDSLTDANLELEADQP